jgi:hypothetical protein
VFVFSNDYVRGGDNQHCGYDHHRANHYFDGRSDDEHRSSLDHDHTSRDDQHTGSDQHDTSRHHVNGSCHQHNARFVPMRPTVDRCNVRRCIGSCW